MAGVLSGLNQATVRRGPSCRNANLGKATMRFAWNNNYPAADRSSQTSCPLQQRQQRFQTQSTVASGTSAPILIHLENLVQEADALLLIEALGQVHAVSEEHLVGLLVPVAEIQNWRTSVQQKWLHAMRCCSPTSHT